MMTNKGIRLKDIIQEFIRKGRLDQYVQKQRGEKEDYPNNKQKKEDKH